MILRTIPYRITITLHHTNNACSTCVSPPLYQAIADLIDPGRIFTSHMLVASYVGTDAKRLTKNASKGRFYTTSVAVRSVFGDAANDSTRRFMQHREDTYLPVPGECKIYLIFDIKERACPNN